MGPASVARVLLDSPLPQLDRLLEYRIPAGLAETAKPGVRVRVPLQFERRIADGYLVEVAETAEYQGALSELEAVISPVAVLTPAVWALARKAADRAAGGASDVLRLAIPRRFVAVEKAWLSGAAERGEPFAPAELGGYNTAAFDAALERSGRLAVDAIPGVAAAGEGERWIGRWAATMAAAATRALARGSVILSVPDYRDQEQLLAALGTLLPPSRIVRLDARQPDRERYREFLRCLEPVPRVIVGNRSVVYAPATQLALIGMWDDGDALHAEPLTPYVHARDVALIRQEQQDCALAFFGHARSTEVARLVDVGWLESFPPERPAGPRVIPTAYQSADDSPAARARIPSTAWSQARAALAEGPVLVQVARPGYAPALACEACGRVARCTRCTGPLGLRTAGATPGCRWCGLMAATLRCTHCGGIRFRQRGQGVVRTADELGRAFPNVPVIIADGERTVLEVGSEPALVIATRGAEPIAAGGYRAVLLLDGERMLARESLRVAEDCLRWWANAAALAADGAPVMLVGVTGSIATALATWRLGDYARAELADRTSLRFPPAVRVATVTGTDAEVARALEELPKLAGLDWLGPAPVAADADAHSRAAAVRAIVRFDYAHGAEVAASLRAELIRNATQSRKSVRPEGRRASAPTLRVRFDDLEPFAEDS